MRMTAKRLAIAGVAAAALTAPGLASANFYGFNAITNNDDSSVATGEAQFYVQVVANAQNSALVDFKFFNVDLTELGLGTTADSSITGIWFDDGSLLSIASIAVPPEGGVSFSAPSNQDLPSGNTIDWNTSPGAAFSADSDPAVQPNGVNPGEYVTITFNLQPNKVLSDVYAALAESVKPANAGTDVEGGLRIAIHGQGFAGGFSETFVNTGTRPDPFNQTLVPIPAAAWLFGSALLGMLGVGYRRRQAA